MNATASAVNHAGKYVRVTNAGITLRADTQTKYKNLLS